MGDAYLVRLNDKRCIGCGLCEENLPDVFAMGEFTARVRRELVESDHSEELHIAARDCPVNAITLLLQSGHLPDDHHEEREDEEECGEIRQYKREHGY